MGVPIILKNGDVFGNLCALDTEFYSFTDRDVRLLQTFASFLSYVIELENAAFYDSLTGLYNRAFMKQYFMARENDEEPFAVLFLDLDDFKGINDTYGHDAGDYVLTEIGKRITKCVKDNGIVVRFAGDEFVIILPDTTQLKAKVLYTSQRILEDILEPIQLNQQKKIIISASIGMSFFPLDGVDMETLIKKADTAMYSTKRTGKNNVRVYTDELDIGQ
jgi:diguanylate cyclase (GGDEF)-like protein